LLFSADARLNKSGLLDVSVSQVTMGGIRTVLIFAQWLKCISMMIHLCMSKI